MPVNFLTEEQAAAYRPYTASSSVRNSTGINAR
jgi:hypothetical protein